LRVSKVLAVMGPLALLSMLSFSALASAGALTDVPEAFGDALGVSAYTAKMIFAVAGILAVSLALAVAGAPWEGYLIIELCMVGLFVVIGWLDAWVLVLAAIIVAVMFAMQVKGGVGSNAG